MTYFDECRGHVLAHADHLIERIKAGRMNASVFETLMISFLDQPAYSSEHKRRLLDLSLSRLDGKNR